MGPGSGSDTSGSYNGYLVPRIAEWPRLPLLPAEFRSSLAGPHEPLARGFIGSQRGLEVGDLRAQCCRHDPRADAYAQFQTRSAGF
jgi:hypothetical protein